MKDKIEVVGGLRQIYNIARVVGIIMFSSLLFYAGIIEFAARTPWLLGKAASGGAKPDGLRMVFTVVSAVCVGACFYLKKESLKGSPTGMINAARRLYLTAIIIYSICEVPAVLGIVLFFSGGGRPDFYAMLAVTALMFAFFFPKFDEWSEAAGPDGRRQSGL
jgi:hypothetical protein